jgi:pilus assembly protein Flp/PilA
MIRDRKGATAIEYGLLCALIGIAMIGAMSNVTRGLGTTFGRIGNVFEP